MNAATATGASASRPSCGAGIDRRGVPWFSIIFGGAFGCLLFLPFGGWAKLVGAITAASSFMYSYAPVAAVSLRKSDPDRPRPYQVPGLNIIAPFSFVVSGLIIYWSGTSNVVKLDLAVLFFLVLYFIARRVDPAQAPIDFKAGAFSLPWIIGLTIFSIFGGSYVGSYPSVFGIAIHHHLPFWWDIGAVAVFSLAVYYYAIHSRLGPERVAPQVQALAGGIDPARIVVHGNAKTTAELRLAVEAGVGLIVIDNTDDIDRLEELVSSEQSVLVRVIPGVRPDTYEAVATGQAGSKFGLPVPAARAAIARLRHSDKLRLEGMHAHIGSQILATEPYAREVEAIAGLGDFATYNLGGGLGVRYTYTDHPPSPEDWIEVLTEAARRRLPRDAELIIEPGRMLVAPFGVTVYRVVSVKGDDPRFVAVDGGMADNMEVALYGQRFEATVTSRVGGGSSVELVGRHCESGDRLISGVPLRDPRPGDLVAVAATGAYCYTMANNYNGAMRPPVVFCADGVPRLVVRRETHADFLSRDVASS